MVGISKRGRVEEGRPTKYKPEYCELLIEHMSQGYSFESFPAQIKDNSVSITSLNQWARVHPEFATAKKRAQNLSRKWWEHLGLQIVTGSLKGASAVTWIFVMKCRFGYFDNVTDLSNLPTEQVIALAKKALEKIEGDDESDNID